MTAIIFAGPSVRGLELPHRPDLRFRPPAKQGDIYRATLARPKVIGLIDGYFEGVPSVWHKEILWALSQGIRVFGSASMGALRAAELDGFGMIGVGRIYQWYRDGRLEDDDEVALIHGPSESGFLPLSEPMVNVRSTCEAAMAAGIIDSQKAETILSAAKLLHYRERNWKTLLAAAGLRWPEVEEFTRWLASGRVDQKQLDAAALIAEVLASMDNSVPPRIPDFRFEWTDLWERVVHDWTASTPSSGSQQDASAAAILDELRLDPDRFAACRTTAVQRAILLQEADRRNLTTDQAEKRRSLARLRERLGLMRKSQLDAWVKNQGLTPEEFEELFSDETRIERVQRLPPGSVDRHILAILRLTGEYETYAHRAKTKQQILEEFGFLSEGVTQEIPTPVLTNWFFATRGLAVPNDLDGFVQTLGLSSRQAFYGLLAAEYIHSTKSRRGG